MREKKHDDRLPAFFSPNNEYHRRKSSSVPRTISNHRHSSSTKLKLSESNQRREREQAGRKEVLTHLPQFSVISFVAGLALEVPYTGCKMMGVTPWGATNLQLISSKSPLGDANSCE